MSEIPVNPGIPGKVTKTGLILNKGLAFKQWLTAGELLKSLDRSLPWMIGDWLNYGEDHYGETYTQALDNTDYEYQTLNDQKWVAAKIEVSRRRENLSWSHHREVAAISSKEQDFWLDVAERECLTRKELRARIKTPRNLVRLPPPIGQYACIVIDPPWEMEKIDRIVRPKQKEFDYPPMSEEELSEFTLPAADDCHLYLWATHKHLPLAYRLADIWGFKYECLMTWVKNVGFTPFSWMRSTEHVLFCRRGGLKLERLGLRLDFNAKVREHSRKPDIFYDLVREVSPGPRIDMFSREKREGFEQWGNEAEKFNAVSV